jgi:NADPH:quinone reductase
VLPDVQNGEVLLKGLYYSVDPYMRERMNNSKSYMPPFKTGKPIEGSAIAYVVESKSEKFNKGDLVMGVLPWRNDIIASEKLLHKIDLSLGHASYFLGVLGMTGLTAYYGLMRIGKPVAGETVVVSGAAGAVGIVAGQIAKIQGCRVIGIAGSDEKIRLLKEEYGFDGAVNYRTTTDLNESIAALCPKGVDIYFDNVGGDISDAVINNINFHGRIVLCGQISLYNSREMPMGPRLQPALLTKSILLQGFIISNYVNEFAEGIQKLAHWVKSGELKFTETIIEGFDNLPSAFIGLFRGENTGKMLVKA